MSKTEIPTIAIEFRRHTDDYHAQIKGQPGWWGCGRSIDEAVGSVVRSAGLVVIVPRQGEKSEEGGS